MNDNSRAGSFEQIRVLMMIHWKESGNWDLYRAIKDRLARVDFLQPYGFRCLLLDKLSYILSEFYLPLIALLQKNSCDIVISWSMRIGICYGLLNRVFKSSRSPKHIIYDFHIDLTRTDPRYRFRLMLLKMAIPGIDFFFVTSEAEKDIYLKKFGIRLEQMAFWPISPPRYLLETLYPTKDFIFAYGNSDRDYDTLVDAVMDIPVKTVIVSKTYMPSRALPAHVDLIREKSWNALLSLIASARIVVIPLLSYRIAAGQLTMMETLALGRPLIITKNMATTEYAVDGKTALFFDAGDVKTLHDHIRYLLDHPDAAEKMGQTARKRVGNHAARRLAVLMDAINWLLNARN
ncbi:MAG: glycosyltransferase [Desulfatirhabdiaceae bacterium]